MLAAHNTLRLTTIEDDTTHSAHVSVDKCGYRFAVAYGANFGHGRARSHVRQKLADIYIRAKLLTLTGARATTKIAKGSIPGPEGSIAKLVWVDLMTDVGERGIELLGLAGAVVGPQAADNGLWAKTHLFAPGVHLGGGTDEAMRNIIGERVLGLPKEPTADKGVPFRELLVGTQR